MNINDSLYKTTEWSVFENILLNLPRTTCSVESWHSSLIMCDTVTTKFAKFVSLLQNEEELVRFKLVQESAGLPTFPNKDHAKEERLKMIVGSYKNYNKLSYFIALSKVYQLKFDE